MGKVVSEKSENQLREEGNERENLRQLIDSISAQFHDSFNLNFK